MTTFIRVAVNVPSLAGVFDYAVPEDLAGAIRAGQLVLAPFGKQKVHAVVLEIIDEPAVSYTKEISAVVDPEPVMTLAQIRLAKWMSESMLAPLASMVGLFLPPGLAQQADVLFSVNSDQNTVISDQLSVSRERQGNEGDLDIGEGIASGKAPSQRRDEEDLKVEAGIAPQRGIFDFGRAPSQRREDGIASGREPSQRLGELGEVQKRLMKLLKERGPLRGRQIDRAMPEMDWRKAAQSLVKRGLLVSQSVLPPARVRPKFIRTAQLAVAPEIAENAMPKLGNTGTTQVRREKAMRYLMSRPEAVNVSWVYAESGCTLGDLQELAERELICLMESEIWRDPLERMEMRGSAQVKVVLSDEQQAVWKQLEAAFLGRGNKPILLDGVTGSGKTELYIQAACEAIRLGKQAIILVPEIALTPQTVQRFVQRFPGQTGLIHSRLSDGERYDTWRRARAGLLKVIIGPRSALFAPLPNVGLIVLDECHDASYYQSEPPFYNATTAAQEYAKLCEAVCVMGSATPSIKQHYQAEMGQSVRLQLKQRVGADADGGSRRELELPPVHVADMREELQAGNRGILSRELQAALELTLDQGEQAILFMNRRGTATYVFCRVCGHAMTCPRCGTPMTYHVSAGEQLLCHRCGHTRQMPKKCPQCGSFSMRAYGLGTEKVEAEVHKLFPKARTLRWDWETTREKNAHEIILGHFAAGRADVLIGTQMLAKGLDLPRVTLVGMVLADVGLFLPDPFAAERVFQVLTQVAGRAGRTSRGGRAILQTFEPEHYVIQAAAAHDVDGFYQQEAAQRRRLGYPPFSGLMRLEIRHHDATQAQRAAAGLAARLRKKAQAEQRKSVSIIGPAPCFYSRLDGKYRWQIVLRGADLRSMVQEHLGPEWRIEAEPVNLL